MFAAFLRIEHRPVKDRYGDKTVTTVVSLSDLVDSQRGKKTVLDDIPSEIHDTVSTVHESTFTVSAISLIVGEWQVKVTMVSNPLSND